ncbi:MarR family winged helix-turn-helix transcriptional regulator [Actinophytocola gossypii]|uniref:MarR family transcriptional regulator n=1 Tax=Actinophytocola gossypii TaxID=2812003 RepID=A0ABT2J6D3_9PSEU|nr:MarR family transcriptional regulator [Actinophytocola gossypii]MCT2583422.1 MarR family transcriptional regulator [Actinophytocola gossypii]
MHETDRVANLLGATALVVTDVMLSSTVRAAPVSPSGAAALVVLRTSPGLSVTELGRRVGLTQSAAARMVDSLGDLVERVPTGGRSVSVRLTGAGAEAADAVLSSRGEPLADLLAALDEHQLETLGELLGLLLGRLYERVGDSDLMCRLCDRATCTTGASCPVGEAARR